MRPQAYDTIIAIDPGASGGIAWKWMNAKIAYCAPMPKASTDIVRLIRDAAKGETLCAIEDIPKFVAGMQTSAAGMAKLHRNYGYLLGILDTLGVTVLTVRPQVWQKAIGAGNKKSYGSRWKAHLKDIAVRRFPELHKEVTLKTADALLILASQLN